MLHTIRTFPFEYSLKEAEIALLGILWDSSETGKPVKYGPLFIREAIRNLPGFDLETKTNVFDKFKYCDLYIPSKCNDYQGNSNVNLKIYFLSEHNPKSMKSMSNTVYAVFHIFFIILSSIVFIFL